MTATFDGTELVNTTYSTRFVKHESVANRPIVSLALAREDGDVLISERYGAKVIQLQGYLKGSSQTDLESKIDAFTELLSRPEKNLDIAWNSGTRRYVATCTKHNFDRDHFNISAVPWTAEFTVSSGVGKDTSTTTPLNQNSLTTTTPATDSFSMLGSKPARPTITLTGANWDAFIRGIEYKNTDTNERLVVTKNSALWGTNSVIINCEDKTVTDNVAFATQIPSRFYGTFPSFRIGTNNVQITVGGIVNQSTSEPDLSGVSSAYSLTANVYKVAQSFTVPYTDDTFHGVTVTAEKAGSPGNLVWRIETDNGGKPSGTLVDASGSSNATGTIAASGITGSRAYMTSYSANSSGAVFTLTAGVTYWLVLRIPNGTADGSNYISIAQCPNNDYVRGNAIRTLAAGDYSDNDIATSTSIVFKVRYGGQPDTTSTKHTVTYTKTYL